MSYRRLLFQEREYLGCKAEDETLSIVSTEGGAQSGTKYHGRKPVCILLVILSFSLGLFCGVVILILINNRHIVSDNRLFSPLSSFMEMPKREIIGFLPYWLIDKNDFSGRNKITTLTYFGLTIDSDGHILKLVNPKEEEPGWTTLKKENLQEILSQAKKEGLKTSLLIHLSNEEEIEDLLENPILSAQNLLNDVTPLIKNHGFDDLNLDIESFKTSSFSMQTAFADFIREIYQNLKRENLATLTIEITPISLIKPRLTNLSLLFSYTDYAILMAYDYHYTYSYLAGPVAPLFGAGKNRELDVETSIQQALNTIPKEKLILGIPLYGYEWDTIINQPGAPVIPGTGKTASSRRVKEIFKTCNQCQKGSKEGQEPYLIIPEGKYFRQIFYEDASSLKKKLDLAKKYQLSGIALWALGYEDETILNPLASY